MNDEEVDILNTRIPAGVKSLNEFLDRFGESVIVFESTNVWERD